MKHYIELEMLPYYGQQIALHRINTLNQLHELIDACTEATAVIAPASLGPPRRVSGGMPLVTAGRVLK